MKARLENQIAIVTGSSLRQTHPIFTPLQADDKIHSLCEALIASERWLNP